MATVRERVVTYEPFIEFISAMQLSSPTSFIKPFSTLKLYGSVSLRVVFGVKKTLWNFERLKWVRFISSRVMLRWTRVFMLIGPLNDEDDGGGDDAELSVLLHHVTHRSGGGVV